MYAVERLSTYITRGVYTVSGPFHPFGGAVDIIVVQQQDGSFKSSPWYVRFGKFQGVLKTKEKIVNICVNGTAAGFHMYLDNKGEAYFLKDSEKQEGEFSASPTSSSDEADEKTKNGRFKKTQSLNFDGSHKDPAVQTDKGNGKIVPRTAPKHARILSLMFGRKSVKEDAQGANVQRVSSLERAEIAADLLDLKWSTNLSTKNRRVDASLASVKPSQSDYADVVDNEKQVETNSSEDDISQVERINSQVESIGDNFETSVFRSEYSQQIDFCDSTRQSFEDDGIEAHTVENGGALFDRSDLVASQVILGSDELVTKLNDSTLRDSTMVTESSVVLNASVESIDSDDKGSHFHPVTNFKNRESTKEITADNRSLRAHEEVVEFYSLDACERADKGVAMSQRVATQTIQTKDDLSVENEETEITSLSYCETLESTTRRYNEAICYNGEQSEFHTEHTSKTNDLFSEVMQPQSGMLIHKGDSAKFSHDNREASCHEDSSSGAKLESICMSTSCSIHNIQEENFEESFEVHASGVPVGVNTCQELDLSSTQTAVCEAAVPPDESLEEDQFLFSDSDSSVTKASNIELTPDGAAIKTEDDSIITVEGNAELTDLSLAQSPEQLLEESRTTQSSAIDIPKSRIKFEETKLLTRSLPSIISHTRDFENPNLSHSISCSLDIKSEPCNIDFLKKDCLEPSLKSNKLRSQSIPANLDSITDYQAADQRALPVSPVVEFSLNKHMFYSGMGVEDASEAINSAKELGSEQGMIAVDRAEKNPNIDTTGGSWRLWPFNFKKSKSIQMVQSAPEGTIPTVAASTEGSRNLDGDNDMERSKVLPKKVRSIAPSSEEIASLNLKEGRNVVTFSFSTAMLGQQQVDARIYLWKWNTRIVVSDVDGTITKSDVLGQFMPLVGVDWTQTGVTHLFSAIKENGYQLLFLSARAISQAYLTRQFLFNLKQDGKALPDGPVVISPDGLFPSLYREVIRRAPHEFKISCLEDIRALFPPDCNPFYAGFGNRDTDEISYLKVGIPKGKIFIINPKGEVAVNRRVDTKSYTSLHALVNDVFPVELSAEQEEYNSWNFWKLPLPDVV